MLQTMLNWILILIVVLYMPMSGYPLPSPGSGNNAELSVAYSGIIEFLELFASPVYYLDAEEYAEGDELFSIQLMAEAITEDCNDTYDKIFAVMAYVADNLYYDYQFLEGVQFRSQQPYEVYTTGIAVCQGYSDLVTVMLRSIGVPCMTATSRTHAYNFAHNGERWIFFDPTWCSENRFTVSGDMLYEGFSDTYFDLSSDEIAKLGVSHQTSHITCGPSTAYLDWSDHTALIRSTGYSKFAA